MNKRCLIASRLPIVAFTLWCAGVATAGAEPKWVPSQEGWVSDAANVLSEPDRMRLSDKLSRFHEETFHQLAVLIVPTLSGESIEAFSFRVANSWGLGYKGFNNGILVTLAMKEHGVRIELGKGMERYISDAKVKSIIDSSMIPAFAKGDFAGGLEGGLDQLMQEARRFVVKAADLPDGAVLH